MQSVSETRGSNGAIFHQAANGSLQSPFVPSILLTDPEQRAALAAARALARRGHRVVTVGVSLGLAGRSRSTSKAFMLGKDTVDDPARFRASLAEIVDREQVDAVVPVTDGASRRLLGHEQELGCRVVGPNAAAYARASDKEHLLRIAKSLGLRVPRQWIMTTATDTIPSIPAHLALVVKPSRSVVEGAQGIVSGSVRFLQDATMLPSVVAATHPAVFPLLIQERVYGDGVGVFLLRHDGQTVLRFGHRRLREKPPAGGVSTYREAIVPPDDVLARCETLLQALEYDGPAMVEFKRDSGNGDLVLMEINARLWGSLQLSIDAGIDFPSTMVALVLGLPLPVTGAPEVGARSFWEFGELDHALALARRSRESLHAPPGLSVGPLAALKVLADRRWTDRPEVFRWRDPWPFCFEAVRWIRGK
jgi:predicted ATP-grasp superfamily ATP-dependent carboligase